MFSVDYVPLNISYKQVVVDSMIEYFLIDVLRFSNTFYLYSEEEITEKFHCMFVVSYPLFKIIIGLVKMN